MNEGIHVKPILTRYLDGVIPEYAYALRELLKGGYTLYMHSKSHEEIRYMTGPDECGRPACADDPERNLVAFIVTEEWLILNDPKGEECGRFDWKWPIFFYDDGYSKPKRYWKISSWEADAPRPASRHWLIRLGEEFDEWGFTAVMGLATAGVLFFLLYIAIS